MANLIRLLAQQSSDASRKMRELGEGELVIGEDESKQSVRENKMWNAIRIGRNAGNTQTISDVNGKYRNKFEQGWLGGVGGDSQFQGINQQVGLMAPKASNTDLDKRTFSTLQPSWVRDYSFAPGLGIDALRSHITWTSKSGGINPETGLVAPVINSGKDLTTQGPIPGTVSYNGGQGVSTTAPVNLHGCEETGGFNTGAYSEAQKVHRLSKAPTRAYQQRTLKKQKASGEL